MLCYLYDGCSAYVLYLSFDSLNILLDQGRSKAKLGDFGFALDLPQSSSGRTLVTAPLIARTNGYTPPEVLGLKFSFCFLVHLFTHFSGTLDVVVKLS